jgi:hypothetical protein
MGLTIEYQLSARKNWSSVKVRRTLETVADCARHLGCASVGEVQPALLQAKVTMRWWKSTDRKLSKWILADEGWVTILDVGEGCQPLALALCKYPQYIPRWHRKRWHYDVPSGFPAGWTFSWFCKTQFAGQHGGAHFIRCHKTVVNLLDFCGKAGLKATVRDDAGYWENRDEAALLKTLKRNEALMAAFGGLLKDMAEEKTESKIESPIFDYTNFERLEHEGWQRYGMVFAPLLKKDLR